MQRISLAVQRGNAASVMGTLRSCAPIIYIYYYNLIWIKKVPSNKLKTLYPCNNENMKKNSIIFYTLKLMQADESHQ